MTPKQKRDAIQKLIDSSGWKLLTEVMDAEIISVAMQLGDDPRTPPEYIHYQRGVLRSASELKQAPHRLLQQLEAELRLSEGLDG